MSDTAKPDPWAVLLPTLAAPVLILVKPGGPAQPGAPRR